MGFSEKALEALGPCYVYALIDPRDGSVFYIGKGTENRVFSHQAEGDTPQKYEKAKLKKIREIESAGFEVGRYIINWGLTEAEAFAAEASLINLANLISPAALTNAVAGHHAECAMAVEDFELFYGAEALMPEDIKHNIMVIKINKLYRRGMTEEELYDTVRGVWRASMNTIKNNNIEYVFGVYNKLIVAVYKPDEWHYFHENAGIPTKDKVWNGDEKTKNRVYFVCNDYKTLDDAGRKYLHKTISELKINMAAQNPITYIYKYTE